MKLRIKLIFFFEFTDGVAHQYILESGDYASNEELATRLNELFIETGLQFLQQDGSWICSVPPTVVGMTATGQMLRLMGFNDAHGSHEMRIKFRNLDEECEARLARKRKLERLIPAHMISMPLFPGPLNFLAQSIIPNSDTQLPEIVCHNEPSEDEIKNLAINMDLESYAPRLLFINTPMIDAHSVHADNFFSRNLITVPINVSDIRGKFMDYLPQNPTRKNLIRNMHESLEFELYNENFIPLRLKRESLLVMDIKIE